MTSTTPSHRIAWKRVQSDLRASLNRDTGLAVRGAASVASTNTDTIGPWLSTVAPSSPVIESWLIAHNVSAFLVVRDGFTVGPYGNAVGFRFKGRDDDASGVAGEATRQSPR